MAILVFSSRLIYLKWISVQLHLTLQLFLSFLFFFEDLIPGGNFILI